VILIYKTILCICSESRCLLALLTTENTLTVHGRSNRRYSSNEGWSEPWEQFCDLTVLYNSLLLKGPWALQGKGSSAFAEYKSRLYELTIVGK
jgi:hypothetical protein